MQAAGMRACPVLLQLRPSHWRCAVTTGLGGPAGAGSGQLQGAQLAEALAPVVFQRLERLPRQRTPLFVSGAHTSSTSMVGSLPHHPLQPFRESPSDVPWHRQISLLTIHFDLEACS